MKKNIGGKRKNAGRPAPLGRKQPVGIRMTPDAILFCRQHPDGFGILEKLLRKSKQFREWNATPTYCSDCGRSLNETGGGNCVTCEGV